ncbi:uncharacterized protein LOC127831054 [Dreissena polymorpha]|uniref:Mannosyl phosphorylinositol ceramide synthase SUR1 n=1 Tax=Dreissena polymorpha TaxID=45954 RepID=A0A9D4GSU5_DREPO|nr:uncharacterized protein LOC127831054 [Dreissena polymorpha]KAH3822308.1 hypothetical protein DPMN_124084 [Dreissena polymorpha]
MRIRMKYILSILLLAIAIVIVVVLGRIFEYVYLEFISHSHSYGLHCASCRKSGDTHARIPSHIHQVFFFETSPEIPSDLVAARQTCLNIHPGYGYTLWNKTAINQLIDAHYPDVRELYESYDHWVKRADVARYLVIHHYGGWYLDFDIECLNSFDKLTNKAFKEKRSIVVRLTDPVGFSNDFIGSTPHHPFMAEIISSLPMSNRWFIFPYPSTVLVTGPTYFWGRFLNYVHQEEFLVVGNHSEYLHLKHGSSWHTWDGVLIWYFFNRAGFFFLIVFLAIMALAVVLYRRRNIRQLIDLNRNFAPNKHMLLRDDITHLS